MSSECAWRLAVVAQGSFTFVPPPALSGTIVLHFLAQAILGTLHACCACNVADRLAYAPRAVASRGCNEMPLQPIFRRPSQGPADGLAYAPRAVAIRGCSATSPWSVVPGSAGVA